MEYKNIPRAEHYAIFVFGSITIPGDERSRQAPGHGYPEHQQSTIDYLVFADREEMEKWVDKQSPYTQYIPAIVKPLTVVKTTKIL